MLRSSASSLRLVRPSTGAAVAALGLTLAACGPDTVAPDPVGSQLRTTAIALVVNLDSGTVRQAEPGRSAAEGPGPNFALVGANEVAATVTNVTRSAVGEFTPFRVRVRFDLALTNLMANVELVPSTFPKSPAAQVVAFPFTTDPPSLFGLKVKASVDWDGTGEPGSGAPWNFFNDAVCVPLTPPGDCFRWEAFGAAIVAAGTTPAQTVGFDVDPRVTTFTVYVAVAADLDEPPGTGAIAGVVTSNLYGALGGVHVLGGGWTSVSGETGLFVFPALEAGTVALTLDPGTLPIGCAAPAPVSVTVVEGTVAQAAISVQCRVPGAIFGEVMSLAGPLVGVQVQVVGTGLTNLTNERGEFFLEGVPAGPQVLTVDGVPAGCTAPDPQPVEVPDNETVMITVFVSCIPVGPGMIAFDSDRGGNLEIYVINGDGSGVRQLTHVGSEATSPRWSPDGQRVAFVSFWEGEAGFCSPSRISLINADGSGQVIYTGGTCDSQPEWSPDGSRIVYVSTSSDRIGEIHVMSWTGADVTNLTNTEAVERLPQWSPDGSRIAFFRREADGPEGLFVMNADGSAPTSLAPGSPGSVLGRAVWSPDGSRIVFDAAQDGNWELYVVNADGSGLTSFTSNPEFDGHAVWSPDGSKIAFETGRDGNREIYVMNGDGSGVTRLTDHPGDDVGAQWSPDGSRIAFTSYRDGNAEIYVMNADGTGVTNLTNGPGTDASPRWAPLIGPLAATGGALMR